MENKLLAIELKKGNREAFRVFFDAHYRQLCNYIVSFTSDFKEAEDIVQTSYIKLWTGRSEIKIHTSLKSYLYKIAYNIYIDQYRKNKKEELFFDALKHEALAEQITYEEDVWHKKTAYLVKAIETLPPRCKEILLLKQEGLKYAKIASKLNISIKTVEVQMGIAFTKIRKAFEDY
ncbi:MAG: sigma-70 family RNA polymerase sigma factor [Cyclobacteriaceae bacterium]|nr:sigma-70 family RNA polymerase sigma factor [Cyclobacteriaceae bacterium]